MPDLIGEVSGEQEILGSLGMDIQLVYRGYQAYIEEMVVDNNGDLIISLINSQQESTTVNVGHVKGDRGDTGFYFTPSIDNTGAISWTNNGGLPNPSTKNIKGDKGDKGDTGYYFTPSVDSAGVISWTNNGGLPNPGAQNIKGDRGDAGFYFTPSVDNAGVISWTNNGGLPNPASQNIKGDKGDTGNAAGFDTPEVTVITLPSGSSATASITASGDATSKKFSFTFWIPRGLDGEGAGDMVKNDYDTGSYTPGSSLSVDNARNLDGHPASYYYSTPITASEIDEIISE